MSTELKLRRGTTLQHEGFTGSNGEVTVNTSTKEIHVHDGLSAGGYAAVSRENLANVGSGLVFAEVPAEYLNVLAVTNGVDDYTIINPDVMKIVANITSAQSTLRGLVTGDSLSFNGFGYSEFSVDGGGYATAQPFGMSSWSHLIRDMWLTSNAGFTGIQDLKILSSAAQSFPTSATNYKNLGINAKAAFYNFTDVAQYIEVTNNFSGTSYLVISYSPEVDAVLFDVNGVEYDNSTPDGQNQGYGYMLVPLGLPNSIIDNVRRKSGTGTAGLWVYGISGPSEIMRITGKGAYTSGQILEEYLELVGAYSPDVIYYMIGANDISASVPLETFRANLQEFIDTARTSKPDCIIVLLSSVPSSSASLARAKTKEYIKVMYEIAVLNECSLIDTYSKLEQIVASYWRFDNIHFNKRGDDIVFNIVKMLTLNTLPIRPDVFVPSRATYLGVNGAFMKTRFLIDTGAGGAPTKTQSVIVHFTAGTPTVLASVSSNTAFANSIILSYEVDGGSDKARITSPNTHAIGTISDVIVGADFTERVVGRFITSKLSMDFARVNSAGRQLIENSNLYAVITFVPV